MKTMLLATAAVLGLGVSGAFADSERDTVAITRLPGVVAQAPVQSGGGSEELSVSGAGGKGGVLLYENRQHIERRGRVRADENLIDGIVGG